MYQWPLAEFSGFGIFWSDWSIAESKENPCDNGNAKPKKDSKPFDSSDAIYSTNSHASNPREPIT